MLHLGLPGIHGLTAIFCSRQFLWDCNCTCLCRHKLRVGFNHFGRRAPSLPLDLYQQTLACARRRQDSGRGSLSKEAALKLSQEKFLWTLVRSYTPGLLCSLLKHMTWLSPPPLGSARRSCNMQLNNSRAQSMWSRRITSCKGAWRGCVNVEHNNRQVNISKLRWILIN